MKQQKLKNKEIDQVGSRLLKVVEPSNEEVEKIVANPYLFDSIKNRIEVDENLNFESERRFVNWNRLKLSLLNRRMAISAVAILVVFIFVVALVAVKNQEPISVVQKKKTVKPEFQSEVMNVNDSLYNSETEIKEDFAPKKTASYKQIISRGKINKSPKRFRKKNEVKKQHPSAKSSVKPKRAKPQKPLKKETQQIAGKSPQKIFYSLSFAENSENGNGNLQIVRTQLSRSELFALGVNLQLENENLIIETELIVGDDGVARAIRVVEK